MNFLCLSTKIAADILPVNTPTTNDTEKNDREVGISHRMGSRNRHKSEKRARDLLSH
jgi:hypothetical protein